MTTLHGLAAHEVSTALAGAEQDKLTEEVAVDVQDASVADGHRGLVALAGSDGRHGGARASCMRDGRYVWEDVDGSVCVNCEEQANRVRRSQESLDDWKLLLLFMATTTSTYTQRGACESHARNANSRCAPMSN